MKQVMKILELNYRDDYHPDTTGYQYTPEYTIHIVFDMLKEKFGIEEYSKISFTDLGCGHGSLIKFLSVPFNKVAGVEFSKSLYYFGKIDSIKYSNLELINDDFGKMSTIKALSNYNIFYTFNATESKEFAFFKYLDSMKKGQIFIESCGTSEIYKMAKSLNFSKIEQESGTIIVQK